MELFHELEKGSDLFPYFDYAHGYGVPQAAHFLKNKEIVQPTFSIQKNDSEVHCTIFNPSSEMRDSKTQLEIMFNTASDCVIDYEDYLFYQFQTAGGVIISYKVIDLQGEDQYSFSYPINAHKIVAYYEGFTQELILP